MDQIDYLYEKVATVFSNYGWYLLLASLVSLYLYGKYGHLLTSLYEKYRTRKFEEEYAAKYHKNPDLFHERLTAQQQWAEKLQEKLNKQTEEHQQKLKEKEERKRQIILENFGRIPGGPGRKLGQSSSKDDSKSSGLKPDYNPLMGAGSSSNYRPVKKSACGGGGCGR